MIREIGQGIDGIVTIARYLPGQVVRTVAMLPESDKRALIAAIKSKLPLGDDMNDDGYYFGNPQLFKMPRHFREPGPPLTPSPIARGKHSLGAHGVGAFKEGTIARALPFIALGIAAIIGYNIFVKK